MNFRSNLEFSETCNKSIHCIDVEANNKIYDQSSISLKFSIFGLQSTKVLLRDSGKEKTSFQVSVLVSWAQSTRMIFTYIPFVYSTVFLKKVDVPARSLNNNSKMCPSLKILARDLFGFWSGPFDDQKTQSPNLVRNFLTFVRTQIWNYSIWFEVRKFQLKIEFEAFGLGSNFPNESTDIHLQAKRKTDFKA